MAKAKTASGVGLFFQELVSGALYKRSQGRVTRQVTFAVLAIGFVLAAYQLRLSMIGSSIPKSLHLVLPGVLLAVGLWISYRVVNLPKFADFLIAVEAEMNKVSWPSRAELYRSSVVVMVVIFLLAAVLLLFDFTWAYIFTNVLGILQKS